MAAFARTERAVHVDTLVSMFSTAPIGETVSYENIALTLGFDVRTRRDIMASVDLKLRKKSIWIENVRSVGYRVNNGAQNIGAAHTGLVAIRRKARNEGARVNDALMKNLPPEEYRRGLLIQAKISAIHDTAKPVVVNTIKPPKIQIGKPVHGITE